MSIQNEVLQLQELETLVEISSIVVMTGPDTCQTRTGF